MYQKISIKDLTRSSIFTALIIVLSYVTIPLPLSPVPVTGQSLAIMLAASILTAKQTILSILTYIFLGIAGLPIFAGGTNGIAAILGPRGGYVVGFLIGGIIINLLKGKNYRPARLIVANTLGGIIVLYICGVIWLSFVTGIDIYEAIISGALPFLPGDIFKAIITAFLSPQIVKRIN